MTRNDGTYLGRVIPSFCMRDSSVVGLRPSWTAAPDGPLTRQPVLSSAARICARSASWSVEPETGGAAALCEVIQSPSSRVDPRLTMTERSMMFASSRTLPGQA
jgi:hypothetical protein